MNGASASVGSRGPSGRLPNALRVDTPLVIYGVAHVQGVVSALERAAGTRVKWIDGRGSLERSALETALDQAAASGLVVVLLGTELQGEARSVLDAFAQSRTKGTKLVALTSAHVPTAEMATLFPLQVAADSVMKENA